MDVLESANVENSECQANKERRSWGDRLENCMGGRDCQ